MWCFDYAFELMGKTPEWLKKQAHNLDSQYFQRDQALKTVDRTNVIMFGMHVLQSVIDTLKKEGHFSIKSDQINVLDTEIKNFQEDVKVAEQSLYNHLLHRCSDKGKTRHRMAVDETIKRAQEVLAKIIQSPYNKKAIDSWYDQDLYSVTLNELQKHLASNSKEISIDIGRASTILHQYSQNKLDLEKIKGHLESIMQDHLEITELMQHNQGSAFSHADHLIEEQASEASEGNLVGALSQEEAPTSESSS